MKPTPTRFQKRNYSVIAEVPIRFSDMDMFRHLNNVAIGQFYEECRYKIVDQALRLLDRDSRGTMVVANVDTAYLGQARYPSSIEVATGVTAVGRTSVTLGQALFFNDECISMADTVIIYMDSAGPSSLPSALSEFFEDHRFKNN